MSFLETVRQAKAYLEEQGRVSRRALKLEFGLDDEQLEALAEELVDIQRVAAREGKAIVWNGGAGPAHAPPARDRESRASSPASVPAPEADAERRHLTVLFCDLVDSTRLASEMDPEDWREVVRGYQEAASGAIARYDGHVAQMLGDGLLVYFGWPRAHEDDAERALHAGRDILRALQKLNESRGEDAGVRLSARIGVHSGAVVVAEMRGGARGETLALGETTNVAARIQGEAEPDTVVVSDATLDLVRGIFVTEELGRRKLKGLAEPVLLHRVLQAAGVRSRLSFARSQWTHFVGREQELGLLIDRFERAVEGDGQTVFVSGDAGLGKSRLALMLRDRVGHQPHTWLECRSSPYAQSSALHPLIELVEQAVLLEPDDPPDKKIRKLEASVASGIDIPFLVPLMADLLGIPTGEAYPPLQLSPELQRERTLETFVAWTLALSEIQPLILLVEDLHWCDPTSLELFGRMVEQIPTSRMLLILTGLGGHPDPRTRRRRPALPRGAHADRDRERGGRRSHHDSRKPPRLAHGAPRPPLDCEERGAARLRDRTRVFVPLD